MTRKYKLTKPRGHCLDGKKFGRLKVLEDSLARRRGEKMWYCRCVCGTTILVPTRRLLQGHTKSCGCLASEIIKRNQKKPKPRQEVGRNRVLQTYKRTSKNKSVRFDLSPADCDLLFSSNCGYCGVEPSQTCLDPHGKWSFTYNGIDAIDNTQDYRRGNITSSCGNCNRAKSAKSAIEFLNWIKKVYEFQKLNEISAEEAVRNILANVAQGWASK